MLFSESGLDRGKHHWPEERWMQQGRRFLETLGLEDATEREVAATNLLLYHSFGPSKLKPVSPDSLIY